MADKTLHSIKFPGLPDTYKIPDIVNEYSTSSAYAVGDYVTKDGKTYKCTTAIASSGEAWNVANWTEVKVGNDLQGEVADLKSASLQNLAGSEPYLYYPCFIPANSPWTVSTSDGTALQNSPTIYCYDENMNQLNSWTITGSKRIVPGRPYDIHYLKWSAAPTVPMMVNIGSDAQSFRNYNPPSEYQIGIVNNKINMFHGLVDYGYKKYPAYLPKTSSYPAEITSFGSQVKINYNPEEASYNGSMRIIISNLIERVQYDNQFNSSHYTLHLKSGKKYRLINKKISGSCLDQNGDEITLTVSAYAQTTGPSTIASLVYSDENTVVVDFTAPNDSMCFCLYFLTSYTLDNAMFDISLICLDECEVYNGFTFSDAITDLKNASLRNLAGSEPYIYYPCFIPANSSWTVSTSDGSNLQNSPTIYCYDENMTQLNSWTITGSKRTIPGYSYDIHYLKWSAAPTVPMMVNIGSDAQPFIDYNPPFEYQVSMMNNKIDILHGLVDYGYKKYPAYLPKTSSYPAEITSFGSQVKINYNPEEASYNGSMRIIISNLIERMQADSSFKDRNYTLHLKNGKKYRLINKKISGSCLDQNGNEVTLTVSAYAQTTGPSTIASLAYRDENTVVVDFTAPNDPMCFCLYFLTSYTLDNAVFDVSLICLDEYSVNSNESLEDITGLPSIAPSIKNRYENEFNDTLEKVLKTTDEPSLVFPLVTDIHRYTTNVETFESMIYYLNAVTKKIKTDFIVNLGDLVEGNKAKENTIRDGQFATSQFVNIGVPYFFVSGNHDVNPYINNFGSMLSQKELYRGFYLGTKNVVLHASENGTEYYVDYDEIGVRLIFLNTSARSESGDYYSYASSVGQFLSTALNTEYNVLLFEHISSLPNQVYNNVTLDYYNDVNNAILEFINNGGKIIQMSGHSHVDIAFVSPWLSIMQTCQKYEQVDLTGSGYQAITGYVDRIGNPARSSGDYTADAWSVCVYKPYSNELNLIRFGAGVDRYFHATPITPQTVTSKLTDVTWSSSNTSIATVNNGVISGVSSGRCAILAKDSVGNYECWTVDVV